MCACMYVYMYVYVHTYIHTCIRTYIHTYIQMYIYIYIYIYIYMYVCMYVYIYMYVLTCVVSVRRLNKTRAEGRIIFRRGIELNMISRCTLQTILRVNHPPKPPPQANFLVDMQAQMRREARRERQRDALFLCRGRREPRGCDPQRRVDMPVIRQHTSAYVSTRRI
jgi:hypothetical protein